MDGDRVRHVLREGEFLDVVSGPFGAGHVAQALWVGRETSINGFAALSGLLMAYFAARFGVLGVYVTGRSREKDAPKWMALVGIIAGFVGIVLSAIIIIIAIALVASNATILNNN